MAIKVSVGEPKTQEKKDYPKLMQATFQSGIDNGIIVLFQSFGRGTVIKTVESSEKNIGYYTVDFVMTCFTDYNEEITLKNE